MFALRVASESESEKEGYLIAFVGNLEDRNVDLERSENRRWSHRVCAASAGCVRRITRLVGQWRRYSDRPCATAPGSLITLKFSLGSEIPRQLPCGRPLGQSRQADATTAPRGIPRHIAPELYPSAVSSTVITMKPPIRPSVAGCSWPLRWVSGMISCETTQIMAPAANPSPSG